jgi:hypothetical protein
MKIGENIKNLSALAKKCWQASGQHLGKCWLILGEWLGLS